MRRIALPNIFNPTSIEDYLNGAIETARWIKSHEINDNNGRHWPVSIKQATNGGALIKTYLNDRTLYSGAAGISFFFIQLYEVTGNAEYLDEAKAGAEYLINTYDPEHRWDKSRASGSGSAPRAWTLCFGSCTTIVLVVAICDRTDRFFFRIDDLQFLHASLLQFAAHDFCQRINAGLIDIRNAEQRRIQFIPRTHRAHDRYPGFLALHDQFDLRCDSIDSIDDIIVLIKREIRSVFRKEKACVRIHFRIRIDVQNTLFHDVGLISSNGFTGGNDLTVYIGLADFIVIDQIQSTYTTSGQCFTYISADTANTEYSYAALGQTFHCLFSFLRRRGMYPEDRRERYDRQYIERDLLNGRGS